MENNYKFIKLSKADINQMSDARREQENENGNGATEEYIRWYKKILKNLFESNKLLAIGAFKEEELISIACFNLINYGNEKKIPYLCAVWTNPEHRGKGLASKGIKKLSEIILEIQEQLQPLSLLTLEENNKAHILYKKIGYEDVSGEMTFLGDVCFTNSHEIKYKEEQINSVNKSAIFYLHDKKVMEIIYSEEQLFAHPTNLDGKMSRICSIRDLRGNANIKTINLFLQHFFYRHRFCKLNVQELAEKEKKLYEIFKVKKGDIEGLLKGFNSLNFQNNNNQSLKIKKSYGVMKKDLLQDFNKSVQNLDFDKER